MSKQSVFGDTSVFGQTPTKKRSGLLFLSFLLVLGVGQAPVSAITWQAGYEEGLWQASDPSPLQCELNHSIPDFGVARFVHRSGEALYLEIDTFRHALRKGSLELFALAPHWEPGLAAQPLGEYQVETTDEPLKLATVHAYQFLEALRQGRMPSLVQKADEDLAQRRRASLTPVRFHPAFANFQRCQAELLPVNYDQVGEIKIHFPVGNNSLNEKHRELLDLLVRYAHADPEIESITVEGHSDSTGSRERNRELSYERAQAVTEYLVKRGLSADLIETIYHGQRYPIADNRTDAGRNKNRRVEVTLNRGFDVRPLFETD